MLDDGLVTLDVIATDGSTTVTTKIANTNEIGERKGVNLPGVALCDLGVPRCCGAFTSFKRLVSISQ